MKILWKITHLILGVLLTLVVWILNDAYKGEFVILHESIWMFIVFSIGIILIPILLLISLKIRKRETKPVEHPKKQWLDVTGTIWNMILSTFLIFLMIYLLKLIADYVGLVELIVVALPFAGYAVLFLSDPIIYIKNWIKNRKVTATPDKILAGFVFFILIISLTAKITLYTPTWAEGLDHTPLFSPGDQPGREYRIPSMIVLPNDTILTFSESREDAMLDWGDIDIVMRKSIDGGKTWGNIEVIRDEGSHTAGNPCPLFDNITKMTWLPYCVDNKRVFVMNSSDFGDTWSTPREITSFLSLELSGSTSPLVMEYGTGPGCGLQLKSGRLAIPSYFFDERGSHIIYSDDHGLSWNRGETLNVGGECQIIETVNGDLGINCRTSKEDFRYVAWSHDGGETWDSPYVDEGLPEIGCMASIYRLSTNLTTDENRILFSNPTQGSRGSITIRISYDEAKTWSYSKLIYNGPAAYSQIVVLSDFSICILFEQGKYDYRESIQFCKFDLEWLTNGTDKIV